MRIGLLMFCVWKMGIAFGVGRTCWRKCLRSGTHWRVFWRHHLKLTVQTKQTRFHLFGGNRSGFLKLAVVLNLSSNHLIVYYTIDITRNSFILLIFSEILHLKIPLTQFQKMCLRDNLYTEFRRIIRYLWQYPRDEFYYRSEKCQGVRITCYC